MKIPDKGIGGDELFREMEETANKDMDWRSGRTFGYAFSAGEKVDEIARRAYTMFLSANALDPRVYPSILRFERDVVSMAIGHLNGDSEVAGNFTSGGTESIMLAVKSARDRARHLKPEITEPEIVLPVTAHAAFHKAAHYLGTGTVTVPVDPVSKRADVSAMEKAVNGNTVLLVASAPSYAFGVVDPIEEIGKLAQKRDIWFHVDGCIGAFVLPFFERLGRTVPAFDLRVPGVFSISMDFHKYAFCPMGASVVLYKNRDLRKYQIYACSDWAGYTIINTTVQSSRSGGPVAAAWAVLQHLGNDGYLAIAEKLLEGTRKVARFAESRPGMELMAVPDSTIVAFRHQEAGAFHMVDVLKKKGWFVHPQLQIGGIPESLHLTILPGNAGKIDDFLEDVEAAIPEVSGREPSGLGEALLKILDGRDSLGPDELKNIIAMAGVNAEEVPVESEPINQALNVLPKKVADQLLIEYYNELFVPSE